MVVVVVVVLLLLPLDHILEVLLLKVMAVALLVLAGG